MTTTEKNKTLNRAKLEAKVKAECSSDNYYDIVNAIDDMSDKHLKAIIKCNGDYDREWRVFERGF